ncbi:MAG: sigma-70 family RNA polymerase sigma factor [Nocardioidaceae bacterium]
MVNGARSTQRHHVVCDKHVHRESDDVRRHAPSAEQQTLSAETRQEVLAALHVLPRRQREVLVLRYYSDLAEADIADALGISRGAVKSHASRGISALRMTLEDQR